MMNHIRREYIHCKPSHTSDHIIRYIALRSNRRFLLNLFQTGLEWPKDLIQWLFDMTGLARKIKKYVFLDAENHDINGAMTYQVILKDDHRSSRIQEWLNIHQDTWFG